MELVLVRHARAEERALLKRDRSRALTSDGRRRMRRAARGLHKLVPTVDVLACSPFTRCRQTADIVGRLYHDLNPVPLPALAPGGAPRAVLQWLRAQAATATIVLVGHEPDLGRLTGYFLTGRASAIAQYKKGAAALLEFSGVPDSGAATLAWFLTAAQLGRQE